VFVKVSDKGHNVAGMQVLARQHIRLVPRTVWCSCIFDWLTS